MSTPVIRPGAIGDDHRDHLKSVGHVSVPDFFDPSFVNRVANSIEAVQDWDFAFTTPDGPSSLDASRLTALSPLQRQKMMTDLRAQAQAGFSMAYYRRDMVPGPAAIDYLAEWISSPEFLSSIIDLTGDPTLQRVDAHLSQYSAGSYLSTHDDTYVGKQRRYAYVMGFTRQWEADWGGLLHFRDGNSISKTLIPAFNTLTVFSVPQMHFVSQVASYAPARRLTVTGWAFA